MMAAAGRCRAGRPPAARRARGVPRAVRALRAGELRLPAAPLPGGATSPRICSRTSGCPSRATPRGWTPDTDLAAWIFTVARNRFVSSRRRADVAVPAGDPADLDLRAAEPAPTDDPGVPRSRTGPRVAAGRPPRGAAAGRRGRAGDRAGGGGARRSDRTPRASGWRGRARRSRRRWRGGQRARARARTINGKKGTLMTTPDPLLERLRRLPRPAPDDIAAARTLARAEAAFVSARNAPRARLARAHRSRRRWRCGRCFTCGAPCASSAGSSPRRRRSPRWL